MVVEDKVGKGAAEVEEVADPTSKETKGMVFEDRGGWKGAVGRRCVAEVGPGFPPDGKTTGGTLNSFAIFYSGFFLEINK